MTITRAKLYTLAGFSLTIGLGTAFVLLDAHYYVLLLETCLVTVLFTIWIWSME